MSKPSRGRREFLKSSITTAAGVAWATSAARASASKRRSALAQEAGGSPEPSRPARLQFAVIGVNHNHIFGQTDSVKRGGGQLVSFYAKEPDLAEAFAKRYPEAKRAGSEQEILDDPRVKLVLSSGIPDERGPLGVRVMKHGKDYMSDKPGMTTLEQLAEIRRVQKE